MASSNSVTEWIAGLKEGDDEAAGRLWERYFQRLAQLARHKLAGSPRQVADEEDVAASVFECLCRGAAAGRFQRLRRRDDLWALLLRITHQKAVDHRRQYGRAKRGKGRVHLEADLKNGSASGMPFSIDQTAGREPTPEFLVLLKEQRARLLAMLPNDALRLVARLRTDGESNEQIAAGLGVSTRSIERAVKRIREKWSKELAP